MVRRGELNRQASGEPWGGPAGGGDAAARDLSEEAPGAGGAGRWVLGAEAGVRWSVQALALLLWAPVGLVFWLPFLLRRTVTYVLAVLVSGLTGGEPDRSELRWAQAVRFYQYGFRRIALAFRTVQGGGDPPGGSGGGRRDATGSFPLELLWAAVCWGAAAWLLGVWPDAPADVAAAASTAVDAGTAAGRWLGAWLGDLFAAEGG